MLTKWYTWWPQKVNLRIDLKSRLIFWQDRSYHVSIDGSWWDKHIDSHLYLYINLIEGYGRETFPGLKWPYERSMTKYVTMIRKNSFSYYDLTVLQRCYEYQEMGNISISSNWLIMGMSQKWHDQESQISKLWDMQAADIDGLISIYGLQLNPSFTVTWAGRWTVQNALGIGYEAT